ncbi:MAG: GNAT family N-acetyltransferase [Dysgonamonadaceae bacterium]|jgi:predicted acetyltransferase|nr:GNAT family N-acetyltransferase [Dysgonamonadaceae bacterium]
MTKTGDKIVFGWKHYMPAQKDMWKQCFPDDEDEFVEFYFREVYSRNNTLVYLKGKEPVAALQMIPFTLNSNGKTYTASYLSGVMTRPDSRRKGYISKLILRSLKIMSRRGCAYSILMPQELWLFDFYKQFGFKTCEDVESNTVLNITDKYLWIVQDDFLGITDTTWTGMIKRIDDNAPEVNAMQINIISKKHI